MNRLDRKGSFRCMKNYKIAFFDIDGTIIPMGTGKVPPQVEDTLLALQEKGILICMATGRGPLTIPKFERVRFDVYMTFNGSVCYNAAEEIYSAPMDHDDVLKIHDNLTRMGKPMSIAGKDYCVSNGTSPDLREYFAIAKEELIIDPDFDKRIAGDVYQVMLAAHPDEYDDVLRGTAHTKVAGWWDRAIDLVPIDCGKGIGVRKILEYYGIPREEAIAFGDGGNDIEMLREAGTGVAMGNATDHVKAQADEVCDSAENFGICTYCETYLL